MSEIRSEIRRLEARLRELQAEEYAECSGQRLDNFRDAVTKTGYFRQRQEFFKVEQPAVYGWNDESGSYVVDIEESVGMFCLQEGGVSIDFEAPYRFSTFEAEEVLPISKAEFEAAKLLLSSVRNQIEGFLKKYNT